MSVFSRLSRRAVLGHGFAAAAALGTGALTPARAAPGGVVLTDRFRPVGGWERLGVVLRSDLPWESSLLQDPCVVHDVGGGPRFKLWYGSVHAVGYATSDDGRTWRKAGEPLLSPQLPTERAALNQPSVVFHDGTWHMTYFGQGEDGTGRIHYATAAEPGGPWTRRGVVLAASEPWEDAFLYNSSLLFDEGVWKMWYTAGRIDSAGGEPEFICLATAGHPGGPWRKHPANPLIRPMGDGGWASLGVGGPNVRKLAGGGYETRIIGWQADYPSRGGRLVSPDGVRWELDRADLELDLGVAGGPEDAMIYRQFAVDHDGEQLLFYNAKNDRPGWNETIDLAVRRDALEIVDPAKWTTTQGPDVPSGASFQVRDGGCESLGNAPSGRTQVLQGNVPVPVDCAISASITPLTGTGRDAALLARGTDRNNHYSAAIGAWGNAYAIGAVVGGQDRKLAGTGDAAEITTGRTYRITLRLAGPALALLADGVPVLTATDTALAPDPSYVGLRTTDPTGRARFTDVEVRAER